MNLRKEISEITYEVTVRGKEMYLAYVQALESLDYGKLNKVFRRE